MLIYLYYLIGDFNIEEEFKMEVDLFSFNEVSVKELDEGENFDKIEFVNNQEKGEMVVEDGKYVE